jgi:hypothetical protein
MSEKKKEFDQRSIMHVDYYVYALIDPRDKKVFYIGKGKGNRVFNHIAGTLEIETKSDKLDLIREIQSQRNEVEHYIIRHGLTELIALELESGLIDILSDPRINLTEHSKITNAQLGHNSYNRGFMSTHEIRMRYEAEELIEITDPVVIININNLYKPGLGGNDLYEATRSSWLMSPDRVKSTKYALSEYRGLIVEVYEIEEWKINSHKIVNGRKQTRWEFRGKPADKAVRDKYYLKSVAHLKKRGAQNPIRYSI